jgi:hypothetical protein
MDFIDDIDLVWSLIGGEVNAIAKLADIIHASVRRRVDLDQVQESAVADRLAVLTRIAWPLIALFVEAIERFRQDPGGGGLPGTAWPRE